MRTEPRQSALELAVGISTRRYKGRHEIIQMLLNAGASIAGVDVDALAEEEEGLHDRLVEMLRAWQAALDRRREEEEKQAEIVARKARVALLRKKHREEQASKKDAAAAAAALAALAEATAPAAQPDGAVLLRQALDL